MNEVTQPVQAPFVPYIGGGEVLRVWKLGSPSTVSVTIDFSEPVELDEFGFGGLRCYSGNCDNGVYAWYDGPGGTGNKISPADPLSYANINFDAGTPLDPAITITELDGNIPGGTTGDGTVSFSAGSYDVSGTTPSCPQDCGKVFYIFNYHSALVTSMVWDVTRLPSGTPSQYLGGINFTKPIIVPLELQQFDGKNVNNNSNILSWSTQSEVNVSHFDVQKLIGGKYTTIQRIAAKNGIKQEYSTYDNKVSKYNYYRLLMVDVDGRKTISDEILVASQYDSGLDINIYPNPVAEELHIDFGDTNKSGYVKIINQLGQNEKHVSFDETREINLTVSDLSAGIYYLVSEVEGQSIVKSISIQR
jgi:hypothetical protein